LASRADGERYLEHAVEALTAQLLAVHSAGSQR
jgi:hypothetical protein